MRTLDEIEKELLEVRALLKKRRDDGSEDTDMLYGAQQALGWVIEKLRSPSEVEKAIERVAAAL